jgi:tRNA pseudouridine32 synthase/23S rRNA pseudouridine746 synthase
VLLARTREWAAILAGLFRERAVGKYYLALSDQVPRKKQGLVVGDMVRSRRGSWMLARTMKRPARTRFMSRSVAPGLRLFVLKPLTGRTHQLRVAMKSLGAPILGDFLYHPLVPDWPDRMYLHAHTLRFVLDGHVFVYRCPPVAGVLFQDRKVVEVMADLGFLENLAWPGGGADSTLE